MSDFVSLKVKNVVRETEDAVTIQFKQPLFRKIKYTPGQFLTVVLNIDGKQVRRAYSMSTTPTLDSHVGITVKRVKDGLVSNYINDNVKKGDSIEIMKPMGNFTAIPNKSNKRNIILIGGGSGITPLMSILKGILYFEPESMVSLIYANQNEDTIIFKQQLDELKDKFKERLHIVHVLAEPKQMHNGYSGLIDEAMVVNICNLLPKIEGADSEYYICGPQGMMDVAKAGLKLAKVPKSRVYTESFVAAENSSAMLGDIEGKKVKIVVNGEENEVYVAPDQSILEAGLDAGLDMPFSCQSGLCTACMGKCTSGDVKMSNNDGLSEDEMKDGYRLLCVGHPMSDDVVVEIE